MIKGNMLHPPNKILCIWENKEHVRGPMCHHLPDTQLLLQETWGGDESTCVQCAGVCGKRCGRAQGPGKADGGGGGGGGRGGTPSLHLLLYVLNWEQCGCIIYARTRTLATMQEGPQTCDQ